MRSWDDRLRRLVAMTDPATVNTLRMSVTANPVAFALVKASLRGSHAMLRLTGAFPGRTGRPRPQEAS